MTAQVALNADHSFDAAHQAEIVLVVFCACVACIVLVLELVSLAQRRKRFNVREAGTRTNLWNLGITLSFTSVTALLGLMWLGSYQAPGSDNVCNALSMLVCQVVFFLSLCVCASTNVNMIEHQMYFVTK